MTKGEETKAAILEQALDLASTLGLEALSIGTLAKTVGMSKSGLFAHFESKEQLQIAVLAATRDRFVKKVLSPALREPRGEPRIVALFEHWVAWESGEFPGGCPFQTAMTELDDKPGPVRDYLVETQNDWSDALVTAARIAVEQKHFREDLDLAQFAFELESLLQGYYRRHRLLRDKKADALVRESFEGLLARARRGVGRPAPQNQH